jgi:hypothetical protein
LNQLFRFATQQLERQSPVPVEQNDSFGIPGLPQALSGRLQLPLSLFGAASVARLTTPTPTSTAPSKLTHALRCVVNTSSSTRAAPSG